jgi:hypothetical protein
MRGTRGHGYDTARIQAEIRKLGTPQLEHLLNEHHRMVEFGTSSPETNHTARLMHKELLHRRDYDEHAVRPRTQEDNRYSKIIAEREARRAASKMDHVITNKAIEDRLARYERGDYEMPKPKPKGFIQELQKEVDDWLKPVKVAYI